MPGTIRKRLKSNKPAVGGWLTVPHPEVAEAMASCGFHWIAVDMEHGSASVADAAACFMAIERRGCTPMARIGAPDSILARRLLDAGARGLILSTTEDADSITALAEHCMYPPAGKRGVGLGRHNLWGDAFDETFHGPHPFLAAQIETVKGVAAAAAIASLPFVDALFIGPYDLSASLGAAGDFTTKAFDGALNKIRNAAENSATALGIHQVAPEANELKKRIKEGYTFVAYGTDATAMRHALGRPADLVEGA